MTKNKYYITGYQLTYTCGNRDSVKLLSPIIADDLELARKGIKDRYSGVAAVNLSYTEVPFEEFDEYDF